MKVAQWSENRLTTENGLKSVDRLDFELQTLVVNYLSTRDELAFRALMIHVDHGTVTITGELRSYYEKQIAMSCGNLPGVLRVNDQLTVPEWEGEESLYPFEL